MNTAAEPLPSGPGINRRELLSVAVAAATLPLAVPAFAQVTPQSKTGSKMSTGSNLIELEKRTAQLWQVTFANPPFNLVVPKMVSALHSVVQEMDRAPQVKVLLFKSAIESFFLNHFDLSQAQDFPMEPADPPLPTWVDLVLRLSKSPVISIASIRGRTRGGGNELTLACDLRYASREHALFGQPEVGNGILPGGELNACLA